MEIVHTNTAESISRVSSITGASVAAIGVGTVGIWTAVIQCVTSTLINVCRYKHAVTLPFSPRHDAPLQPLSGSWPVGQLQVKLPSVLAHDPMVHMPSSSEHSLISVRGGREGGREGHLKKKGRQRYHCKR